MRIHNRTIKGTEYHAYNDSGVEWCVYTDTAKAQYYSSKAFTMTAAIRIYSEYLRITSGL